MTCISIGDGFICGFHPTISYKGFIFEWHNYTGPMELKKLVDDDIGEYYEPIIGQSTTQFYEAAQEWHNLPKDKRIAYQVKCD